MDIDEPTIPEPSAAVKASFVPIMKAIGLARDELLDIKDVVVVRPGYKYPPQGKPEPAMVVAVTPGTKPVQESDVQTKFGVPVSVIDATVEEQMAATQKQPVSFGTPGGSVVSAFEQMLGGAGLLNFAPPKTGKYKQPDPPNLPLVDEEMDLTICISPEAGWSELEAFLGDTKSTLTVAMYQFTAPHIFEAIEKAVSPAGRKFELILHPVPEKPAKSGVKAQDLDEEDGVIDPLEKEMKNRFQQAWATLFRRRTRTACLLPPITSRWRCATAARPGFPAVTGNHRTSRMSTRLPKSPDDLPADFQRKYNRDYHAIIDNKKMASIYEFYIKRDFDLSSAQADFAAPEGLISRPDLFVPVEEEEPVVFAPKKIQMFKPLKLKRQVKSPATVDARTTMPRMR